MSQCRNHITLLNNITMKRNKLMEELREQITPEIRELVDNEMLVETRLLKWMKQTKKEKK